MIAGLFGITISKIATDAINHLQTVEIKLQNAQKLTEDEQRKANEAIQKSNEANKNLNQKTQQLNDINKKLNSAINNEKQANLKLKKIQQETDNVQTQAKVANELLIKAKKEKIVLETQNKEFQIRQKIIQEELQNSKISIAKIRELSAVASQLQQKGQNNEANQFLNIAGLVLQDKIKNQELKEALLASSLVLGYEYLVNTEDNEDNKNAQFQAQYKKATEEFNKSIAKLPKDTQINNNDSSYLATLVYIYYVKGKLEPNKSLDNYKTALSKYNLLQSQFKSRIDLFKKLDLNILYNGNADIVASLYRQLQKLDNSNIEYNEGLKAHLLNELDFLMKARRWQEADQKSWQVLLVSAKREEQDSLDVKDIRNLNCKDLKKVDDLWVNNSNKKFGYSVQKNILKKIFQEIGNSLYIDWERGVFTNLSDQGYDKFAETVGWKNAEGEGSQWMTYDELSWEDMKSINTYKYYGTLPYTLNIMPPAVVPLPEGQLRGPRVSPSLPRLEAVDFIFRPLGVGNMQQKLVDCSR